MTTERLYLLLTAILTGALWIPVVIGYVSSRGMLKSSDYKVARAFKFGGGGRGILHWQMGKARVSSRACKPHLPTNSASILRSHALPASV
jgi:hypothetical protein